MQEYKSEPKRLYILWTNDHPHTSRFMVFMYAKNSMLRGWWDEVTVIIWGATATLAGTNPDIQEEIRIASSVGVKFSACIACARELGVVDALRDQGIEVKPWGEPLTQLLKAGEHLITI